MAITGAIKTTSSYTPTAETKEVTLGTDIIDITRVTFENSDGDITPLEGKTREDWDFYSAGWENEGSGTPKQFAWDPSNSQLILRPKPDSNAAVTNGLKVWEVNIPTALTGDSSTPFDANVAIQAYAMVIVHGVTALCWMDDGTPEALAKARFHRSNEIDKPGEFERYIKLINSKFTHPIGIATSIKWSPQGPRLGSGRLNSTKEYPN